VLPNFLGCYLWTHPPQPTPLLRVACKTAGNSPHEPAPKGKELEVQHASDQAPNFKRVKSKTKCLYIAKTNK